MDKVFKALSDPNRRKIISLLRKKTMSVSDLLQNFEITQASLSHHLDILKRADLVRDQRKGQFIYYSLNMSVFEELIKVFLDITNKNDENK